MMRWFAKNPLAGMVVVLVVGFTVWVSFDELGSSKSSSSSYSSPSSSGGDSNVMTWVIILALVAVGIWLFVKFRGSFGGGYRMVGAQELRAAQREQAQALEQVRMNHTQRMRSELDRFDRERRELVLAAQQRYAAENGRWL